MNKISQKMIEIAEKLNKKGLSNRAEQFYILAENIEDEILSSNIPKINSFNINAKNNNKIEENKIFEIFSNKILTPYLKYK